MFLLIECDQSNIINLLNVNVNWTNLGERTLFHLSTNNELGYNIQLYNLWIAIGINTIPKMVF